MKALMEALEASSVAVWDYDVPQGRIWLSAEWGQLLGYGRASGVTTPEALLALVPDEDRPAVGAALRRALAGQIDSYRVEHRVRGKDRLVWVQSTGKVVERDAGGRVVRMAGTNADVTPIKDAEAAVHLKEEQMRLIMDAAPALIGYVDRDMRLRFHNKAYERLFVLSAEQIVGRHAREVIGEEAFRATEDYARRALGGEAVEFERVQPVPGGDARYFAARYVPHRLPGGEVVGFVGVLVDITDRKKAEAKVAALAFTDPLTGLPNRRTLEDRLSVAVPAALRRKSGLALLFIDLDGFKPVNDRLGHEAGDGVLVEIAKRIAAAVRETDTVARVGGDEFVILLVDPGSRETVQAKAAALMAAIGKPMALPGGEAAVGASIGIALCPEHGGTPAELTRRADAAMYAAKRAGRGASRFAEG